MRCVARAVVTDDADFRTTHSCHSRSISYADGVGPSPLAAYGTRPDEGSCPCRDGRRHFGLILHALIDDVALGARTFPPHRSIYRAPPETRPLRFAAGAAIKTRRIGPAEGWRPRAHRGRLSVGVENYPVGVNRTRRSCCRSRGLGAPATAERPAPAQAAQGLAPCAGDLRPCRGGSREQRPAR
jgi:hypothetical protein